MFRPRNPHHRRCRSGRYCVHVPPCPEHESRWHGHDPGISNLLQQLSGDCGVAKRPMRTPQLKRQTKSSEPESLEIPPTPAMIGKEDTGYAIGRVSFVKSLSPKNS